MKTYTHINTSFYLKRRYYQLEDCMIITSVYSSLKELYGIPLDFLLNLSLVLQESAIKFTQNSCFLKYWKQELEELGPSLMDICQEL